MSMRFPQRAATEFDLMPFYNEWNIGKFITEQSGAKQYKLCVSYVFVVNIAVVVIYIQKKILSLP